MGAKRFSILLSVIKSMKKRGEEVFDGLVDRLDGSFNHRRVGTGTHMSRGWELKFYEEI